MGLAACGGTASEEPEALARTEQAHEQGRFTGAIRWARHITGEPVIIGEFPREKSGTAVKDGEEHLLALYGFTGNIDLGEHFVRAPGGPTSTAIVLARYAQKTGRLEWLKVFGPGPGVDGDVFGGQLAVDSQRNIILQAAALGVDFGDGRACGPTPARRTLARDSAPPWTARTTSARSLAPSPSGTGRHLGGCSLG